MEIGKQEVEGAMRESHITHKMYETFLYSASGYFIEPPSLFIVASSSISPEGLSKNIGTHCHNKQRYKQQVCLSFFGLYPVQFYNC